MDAQKNGPIFSTKDDLPLPEEKKKQDDDSSISSTEDTLMKKPLMSSSFIVENIRFSPKVLEFNNAFEGKQFSEKLTIQNVGRNPVVVKIGEPNSFIFQLRKPSSRVKFLPSGASITKTVTYTYHNDDLVQRSQIPIHVNGLLVDYPVVVKKAEPEIEVHPQKLNFEIINLGASAKSITLTIRNTGGRRTKFEVDCGKHLDLVVNPTRGTVKPKHSVNVCVEIMGFCEGEYYRELWIKTTEVPIRVPVLVEVVRPKLEIVYPMGTENFTLINFRPTYSGTQRVNSFVLKNVSNEPTLFVVLAEVDGKLMDLGEAKQMSDSFNTFQMPVVEGCLAPFESRIFNVLFCPKTRVIKKGWHHNECKKKSLKSKSESDHIAFIWVQTVFYIDRKELAKVQMPNFQNYVSEKPDTLKKSDSVLDNLGGTQTFRPTSREGNNFSGPRSKLRGKQREDKSLRFCFHGQALDPNILIQPTAFEFGDLNLDQTENKVLRITNNSIIGVRCKLNKTLNVVTKPQSVWLKPEKAQEFLISLTPKSAGNFKLKLKIQILAESDVLDGSKGLVTIAVYTAIISFTAHNVFTYPAPKLGLGITPLIVDDVGFQKDSITFKDISKLPYAAVLGLKKGFKPEWMKKEKDQTTNVKDALVALPNDRPRFFHSWPKDKVCRSIFKGFFRYSPPEDLAYTLSTEGRIERKERDAVWMEYISKKLWQLNQPEAEVLMCLEKALPCGKYHHVDCHNPGVVIEPSKESSKGVKDYLEQNKKLARLPFIPLSPMFLFLIKVDPKLINFSMVPVSTEAQETIIINNQNPFPISIKFTTGSSNVWVLEAKMQTVEPNATKAIEVCFKSHEFGRYFGFLNYVINGAHEFKITISAFVTTKTLFINNKYLNLEFDKTGSKDCFQHSSVFLPLENFLPSPVKYKMSVMEDSNYDTEIKEGEIPPRSVILTEVYLKLAPRKSYYTEITVISESGNTDLIKVSFPFKKFCADFLNSFIDMRDIPLNLPTKVKPIIFNGNYHDVCFEVLDPKPIPGVTIIPKSGIIRARSFFPLAIIVKIPVLLKFSFVVMLNVYFSNRISITVTGNVVYPLIRLRPSEITMKKICEGSLDIFTICVTNEGTTQAEMKVDFTTCPEFHVVGDESEFTLLPNDSKKLLIRFDPVRFTRYVFYLPLTINNILGPPMLQEQESELASYYISQFEGLYMDYGEVISSKNLLLPCVCINCTVTQPLLQITPLFVDFSAQQNSEFRPHRVEISNVSDEIVTFCISTADFGETNECPFELTPVESNSIEMKAKNTTIKVRLNPSESLALVAKFTPNKYGTHEVDIPIFVKGYNNGLVYNNIHLKGTVEVPQIFPKSSEVYFPPLPLGVACEAVLTIYAENYSSPDFLKCLVWFPPDGNSDYFQDLITTQWLTEPYVAGPGRHSFQLLITFQSFIPVSLRSYVIVCDSVAEYATIMVTAIADNSSVTVHAFLSTKPSRYKLLRDVFIPPNLKEYLPSKAETKSELKFGELGSKVKVGSKSTVDYFMNLSPDASSAAVEPIEKGPSLAIQVSKSMNRISQLDFAKVCSNYLPQEKTSSNAAQMPRTEQQQGNFIASRSSSTFESKFQLLNDASTEKSSKEELPYPNFPAQENSQSEYFNRILTSVEKWMFEVVMRCDQYFSIPQSFQRLTDQEVERSFNKEKTQKHKEKDFLHFLEEIIGPGSKNQLPKRPIFGSNNAEEKAEARRMFFLEILLFLQGKGCLLPHIKPEYLMEYDDYEIYVKSYGNTEVLSLETSEQKKVSVKVTENPSIYAAKSRIEKEGIIKDDSSIVFSKDFWGKSFSESVQLNDPESEKTVVENQDWMQFHRSLDSAWNLLPKKSFKHSVQILDEATFEMRSTQSWLDIVVQIFRVFVMNKLVKKTYFHLIKNYEMSEKKIPETGCMFTVHNYFKKTKGSTSLQNVDSLSSNIYTSQERVLLGWLNHHLQLQKDSLWKSGKCLFADKILNNFTKDLSDSVALISLTASYCPYIIPECFADVFAKPETPNQILHNAGRLIQSWRTLQFGLSVETWDITKPNPVFMVMLLTHLYDVLPSLHPRSIISFSAPLNSDVKRTIQVKNESEQRLLYSVKFFGESRFFRVKESTVIDVKPGKSVNLTVLYSVRKIRKVTAYLFLCGSTLSPDFAKHMAFCLEGEPSVILETEKLSFAAPLHKMICTDILVKPPYPDSTTYEIWYTTMKPSHSHESELSFKPWSSIWKKKVSRRLFLNSAELKVGEDSKGCSLSLTVACLTYKKRNFWLLFRSPIGDFIILIEINTKAKDLPPLVSGYYAEGWSSEAFCTCPESTPFKFDASCPFLVLLDIPIRNHALWNSLRQMFLKTLNPQETLFWNKHFEMDIGLCLILWFLSPEEEEEVVDEFVDFLATKVTFTLKVESPEYVTLPQEIEIPDVREESEIQVPIHISKNAPGNLTFNLIMTSENEKEIRNFRVRMNPSQHCGKRRTEIFHN